MRILHVVPTYLPATRYGGPIVAVHGLCRALAARGHAVDVFTTDVDGDGRSDVPLGVPVTLDGVRVHYFASPVPRIYFSPAMGRALRRAGDYDMVHLHSVFLWPTYAAAKAARKAGVPCLVSPRGMLVPELIRRKSRLAKSVWIALFERRTLRHSSSIHFTARREWDDARRTGLPLPSPFVVPNGIDLPAETGVDRRDDTLLFLGRINWKKGLDRLIEAMRRIPEARLLVAGNDEEDYARTLPRLPNVEFVGPVRSAVKDELLQSAAALVLPSHSENFGNVVLEAMAARTPVIVTPEVGLADEVASSGAGVVVRGEAEPLAAAIRELLRDHAGRDEMGRRGRAAVEQRFTWERVAEQMEEAYGRLSR